MENHIIISNGEFDIVMSGQFRALAMFCKKNGIRDACSTADINDIIIYRLSSSLGSLKAPLCGANNSPQQ